MTKLAVLWSFRRCPYAMRARLAIVSSGTAVELREISLKDKPAQFLASSPKGTVPVLVTNAELIEESRDIMAWALAKNDPEGWLQMPADGYTLMDTCDGPFKRALDHTKYAVRFPDLDRVAERSKAGVFLENLDDQLSGRQFLFGRNATISDMAIAPFVRQFANIDRDWFCNQGWSNLVRWLDNFLSSDCFERIMAKHPLWQADQQNKSIL